MERFYPLNLLVMCVGRGRYTIPTAKKTERETTLLTKTAIQCVLTWEQGIIKITEQSGTYV